MSGRPAGFAGPPLPIGRPLAPDVFPAHRPNPDRPSLAAIRPTGRALGRR